MIETIYGFSYDKHWYEHDKDTETANTVLASCLLDTVREIERRQASIVDGNRRHARIYAGYLPTGLQPGSTTAEKKPFAATRAVIRSICDTASSLIIRSRPTPSFVTDKADWDVQMQAEDAEQFCIGAYHRGGVYPTAARAFHDATIFGTGGWKYIPVKKGDDFYVECRHILIDDIVVDEEECRETLIPDSVYHRMQLRTDSVIRKYCKGDSPREVACRRAILAAKDQGWPARSVARGQCIMVDAYYVDPIGNNHRHVVAVEGAVLKDEPWAFAWHPFTFLWWTLPITGFYGDGIAYRQYGRQERISYMYRWVQKVHDLFATPTAWVDPTGGPPTMHMSNEVGRIMLTRKPPSFSPNAMIHPEVYHWIEKLEAGGFDDEGISQSTSNNTLPPGLESAPAQREYSWKEGQRFSGVSQRWEDSIAVETAEKLVAFYRKHVESTESSVTMRWPGRKFIYEVKWPDLDENAYMIRAEAASLESLSPAARTQSALELAQTGWITPQQGRALVGHPDLKEADELDNAPEDYAKMVLYKLYRGEIVQLDEMADMSALDRIVRQGRLVAIQRNAPARIVDNMSRYLEMIDVEKQNQAAAVGSMMQTTQQAPVSAMASGAEQAAEEPFGH